jgi:hypothetical protein
MRNMTTGMHYVGQTYNLTTRSYCGSGKYWVTHCKKHGGYSRKNIEVVEKFWAEDEAQAHQWLDAFEANNPDYFVCSNSAWANRARETTGNSAFCGLTKENRVVYARAGGLATAQIPGHMSRIAASQGRINVESGHMQCIQKIGASLGGKINGPKLGRRMVESGQLGRIHSMGGKAACAKNHAEKDPVTGKSYHAVKVGKASGVTRGLMKQFCKEHGIDSPGVNYINMDKSAFKQWRAQHAG